MPPSPMSFAVLAILTLLAGVGPVGAQSTEDALKVQREVAAAYDEAVAATLSVQDELAALVPSVPGWTCKDGAGTDGPRAHAQWMPAIFHMAAIPHVGLTCDHGDRSIHLELVLDAHAVSTICGELASLMGRNTGERPAPENIQVDEDGPWRLLTSGRRSLRACVADRVGVSGWVRSSPEAVQNGPAATDAFVQALVLTDPAPLFAAVEAAGLDSALAGLVASVEAQSRLMAESLPAPAGATRKVVVPNGQQLSPYEALYIYPSAFVTLDWDDCQVWLMLGASPFNMPKDGDVQSWYLPPSGERPPDDLFLQSDAGRIVGWERADGTRIAAVVDGRVAVSAMIAKDLPCEDDPGIARRFFEEIVARDLSVFSLL